MVIPREIYAECERQMRQHGETTAMAERRLHEARRRAYSTRAAALERGGGHGGRTDGLERRALSVVEAQARLNRALCWDRVIERLAAMYPETCREGAVFALVYRQGLTQQDACRELHLERKTVRRCRDTLVVSCALLAVEARLLRLGRI